MTRGVGRLELLFPGPGLGAKRLGYPHKHDRDLVLKYFPLDWKRQASKWKSLGHGIPD